MAVRTLTGEMVELRHQVDAKFRELLSLIHTLEDTEGIDQLHVCNAKLKLLTAKIDTQRSFPWYRG